MSQHIQFDIVIVGGGIAGSALACALDNCGLKILLLESGPLVKLPELEYCVSGFDSRVSALTAASEQFLDDLSVWPAIKNKRAGQFTAMHVFDGEGTGNIEFTADDIGETHLGHIVENRIIVAALQQKLSFSANVKIIEGVKILQLSKNESGYRLECEDQPIIETKLLIGADGANSFVRQQCDFETREWSYRHNAIVCTVETDRSHQQTAWQSFTQYGPLAFLPLASDLENNNFSSIVWSLNTDESEKLLALNDESFQQALSQAIENKCGQVISVSKRFSFPLRQRHAINYSKNSVALIGDAAHTIHPLAGQGINLGLKDVKVLAEEIIAALNSHQAINDIAVLKRYERRRKGDNLAMMAVMEGFKRLYGRKDLVSRLVRNRGMDLIDSVSPVKKRLIRQAMGL